MSLNYQGLKKGEKMLIKPKSYNENEKKITPQMHAIENGMPSFFRPGEWSRDQVIEWNMAAKRYNALAAAAGISKGFWKVTINN